MFTNQTFANEEQADEVLEYYENFILRCTYVAYIAVVKEGYNFKIEIGINSIGKGKVKYDKTRKLSPLDVLQGKFDANIIPSYFPIPSEFKHKIKTSSKALILYNINFVSSCAIQTKSNSSDKKKIKTKFLREKVKKSYFVKNIHNTACTMGSTFKLLQFPNDIFGITNQHLFSYQDARLGDCVYNENDEIIGESFWVTKDYDKEVAIIKICKNHHKDYSNFDTQLPLGFPQIGMKVIHNGFSSNSKINSGHKVTSIIRSVNATIRKVEANNSHNWSVYKHQLLMDDFTVSGDSGALIISADENDRRCVVGLNFAKFSKIEIENSAEKNYTIANNINGIFNHKFSQKQEILVDNDSYVTTTFINEFILKNQII